MDILDPTAPTRTTNESLNFNLEGLMVPEAPENRETVEIAPIARAPAEPTAAEPAAGLATGEAIVAKPLIPIPIKRKVSGSYRSVTLPWELILRVDVDRMRAMNCVSGDYYKKSGSTTTYFGSFVVENPVIALNTTHISIVGLAKTTWPTSFNKLSIRIARNSIFQPAAPAEAQWMTAANVPGAKYTCQFDTLYFRTVDLEQDHEMGVTPFTAYNTGSLPSGGPARTLNVVSAYAEAGIHMRDTGMTNEVAIAPGGTWSNAELHAAMQANFSKWQDTPQWKVWLFHAMRHDMGPGLLGIMFDQQSKQRQGCAAFYQSISGTTATKLRDKLYVCVHELGHCFNLYHSFHKSYMNPPLPNRPAALSWMNYPQNYPGGSAAFWAAFPYQFDNLELIHLRHAFRNNIIMGGNPFGTGAALLGDGDFSDAVEDQAGLRLVVDTARHFAFGEPVRAEIKLYLTDTRGKRVHSAELLNPNFGFVQLAIQRPNGQIVVFEPPIDHCAEVSTTMLNADNPSIYESVYIGCDKEHGQLFDQPGTYRIRGVYYALDGSEVVSNTATLRVRAPLTAADQEVGELLLGDQQGMLLYLNGSDSPFLKDGNEALDLLLDKHGKHPLAIYAQMVKGQNAAREFKTITPEYEVKVRKPNYDDAAKLLAAVVAGADAVQGVDNITLNATMQRLARTEAEGGHKKEAQDTIKRMVDVFLKKGLKPHVLGLIKAQADQLKQQIQV